MNKKMLIDTSHKEETRVVVLNGNSLEDYDVISTAKKQIKGNIYLAKVVRIEPSLQAAFVDYGGNKQGFLAFSDIHPDYYQIPVADREALLALQEEQKAEIEELTHTEADDLEQDIENGESTANYLRNDETGNASRQIAQFLKRYKIQEVIHRRQILLVQVIKEERGNKGAALTTYLSLAGRYCVLMPNSLRAGGISRKITAPAERRRLREIIDELDIPSHMGLIIRTAGAQCPKPEALRDGEYLLNLWDDIRERTLQATAPTLIYEDSCLIKRAIRDIFTSDIQEILVDGEEGWAKARDLMRVLMPHNMRRLQLWKDRKQSLFSFYHIEDLLDQMLSPIVQLRSGGYLVINQTEALVAIDVNSGRSIKERNLEETALRTNQEAADEIARQLRLRDLAGLIVIDFIDMESKKHNYLIERRLKTMLHKDRARIQVASISMFGLLEMTRQRLRPSIAESAFETCSHCNGVGVVRSLANSSLRIIRLIDEEARKSKPGTLTVYTTNEIALYILNKKRNWLSSIEKTHNVSILFAIDEMLAPPQIRIEYSECSNIEPETSSINAESAEESNENLTANDDLQNAIEEIIVEEKEERYPPRRRRNRRQRNHRYQDTNNHDENQEVVPAMSANIEHVIEIMPFTEDEQPKVPFHPIVNQNEYFAGKPQESENHRPNRRSRFSRWKKERRQPAASITGAIETVETRGIIYDNIESFPTEIIIMEAPNKNLTTEQPSMDAASSHNEPTTSAPTADIVKHDNSQPDTLMASEEALVEKKTRRRSTKTKTAEGKTTRKTTKKASANPDVKTEEEQKVSEAQEEKKETPKKRRTAAKTAKTSTTRTKKVASTTTKKSTKSSTKAASSTKTAKAKKTETENQAAIAPIVIDDAAPAPKPRSGWWKR